MKNRMDDVKIKLSKDEALVLFELLSRFSDTGQLMIADPSEERVLWKLTCLFEKSLSEPFSKNWLSTLEEARNRLIDDVDEN